MKYTCDWCGYEGQESEFLDGFCPRCDSDIETGDRREKPEPESPNERTLLQEVAELTLRLQNRADELVKTATELRDDVRKLMVEIKARIER